MSYQSQGFNKNLNIEDFKNILENEEFDNKEIDKLYMNCLEVTSETGRIDGKELLNNLNQFSNQNVIRDIVFINQLNGGKI